jgi:hypothetical protein
VLPTTYNSINVINLELIRKNALPWFHDLTLASVVIKVGKKGLCMSPMFTPG